MSSLKVGKLNLTFTIEPNGNRNIVNVRGLKMKSKDSYIDKLMDDIIQKIEERVSDYRQDDSRPKLYIINETEEISK